MADLGRRRFLAGSGLAAGLFAACRSGRDAYSPDKPPIAQPPGLRPGSEKMVVSTCGLCAVGCGVRVRVVDGRAVKVEGNPESSVNRGSLCVRGAASLELLYHPNRVAGPMRRRGGRGEKNWQPISWDDAIAELAGQLRRLHTSDQVHRALLLDGESSGTTHALWGRLMGALGSPNHVGHGAMGRAAVSDTLRTMIGAAGLPGYDFERASCAVLVGTGALEASHLAMPLARAFAGATRPRLICLSPRLPGTSPPVEDWLAVAPEHWADLLFAILHVLLREQLVDESPIEEALEVDRFREQMARRYAPERVSRLAGVSAGRIETLARDLVANHPSVIVVDEETKDATVVAAAVVLNALLGSIGVGGMQLGPEEPTGFTAGRSRPGEANILAVPEAILSGTPHPIELLLLSFSNPVFSKPDGAAWTRAMAKVPFIASFAPVFDESTAWADLLLPDLTYLERWDVIAPSADRGVLSLRQPVVASRTDGMQTGDVILRLAAALGGEIAEALPWKSHREAAIARVETCWGPPGDWLDQLESKGVCELGAGAAEPPPVAVLSLAPALATETAPMVGDAEPFPFVLHPFRDRGHGEGGSREYPWLTELGTVAEPWSGYLEVAGEDARRLAIEDGDWVAVTSPIGRVELRVRVQSRIKAGVLGLRVGGWGRRVGDSLGTPARVLAGVCDSSGHWRAFATRAKVEKIG